jgi:hypothetical protein
MPKKKEKIVSLEVIETNSLWDYRNSRILQNFICKKDDTEKTVADMDLKDYWKHEKNYANEVKAILAAPGTRNSSSVFFTQDVNVEEVKLPVSVKASTKYVYKVYDYLGDKLNTEYGTQKDILGYIGKKIKTKYVYVTRNGVEDRIEYSQKAIADIFDELEETTSQLEIVPAGRSGATDDSIIVSIFKNCMK